MRCDIYINISGLTTCSHLATDDKEHFPGNAFNNTTDGYSIEDLVTASILLSAGGIANFANFLTLATVFRFKSLSVPDVWIFSLALSDYLFATTTVAISVYDLLTIYSLTDWLCSIFAFTFVWFRLASTTTVTLMIVDRYLALRKPILYRTRFTIYSAKRIVMFIWIVGAIIAVIPFTNWSSFVQYHGFCIYDYSSNYATVVLAVCYLQFMIVLYTYIEFIFSMRKFIERRHDRRSTIFSDSRSHRHHTSIVLRGLRNARDRATNNCLRRESDAVVQAAVVNSVNVNKCTRMAKTVAVIVLLYYLTWSVVLVGITYELAVGRPQELLKMTGIRAVLLNAVLNPIIYAAICNNYRRGYNKTLCNVICICGCKLKELPFGMTGSQVHRIAQQMVSASDNSPGLVRRLYSKRGKSDLNSPELQKARTYENPAFIYNQAEEKELSGMEKQADLPTLRSDGALTVHVEATISGSPSTGNKTEVIIHQEADSPNSDTCSKPSKACQSHFIHMESIQSDSGCDVESVFLDGFSSKEEGQEDVDAEKEISPQRNGEHKIKHFGPRNIGFCAIQESVTIKTPLGKTMSLSETYELSSKAQQRTPIAKKVELFNCKSLGDEPSKSINSTPHVRIELEVLEISEENIETCSIKSNISQSSAKSTRSPCLRFSTKANRFVANDLDETDTFSVNFGEVTDDIRKLQIPDTIGKSPKCHQKASNTSSVQSYQEDIMKLNDYVRERDISTDIEDGEVGADKVTTEPVSTPSE
ncbi:uncharacterized protein LOC144451229 [Glandiceps talaboti]